MKRLINSVIVFASLALPGAALAQTDTTFTYQGELKVGGVPTNGAYNVDFTLWDALAGGTQIGGANSFIALNVTDGLFTVDLDFGASAFDNSARWLKVTVNGMGLSPRTPIRRAPYAIQTRGIFVNDDNEVGIGTTNPQHLLHVVGDTNAAHAIYGHTTELANAAAGVYGRSDSSNGYGVYGHASSVTGTNYGVLAECNGAFGFGVFAHATHTLGQTYGVFAQSRSNSGTGVYGYASSLTGNTTGVWGRCNSPSGFAGRFEGRGHFSGNVGFGVANPLYPVQATSNTTTAIYGEGPWGVEGASVTDDGRGVFGFAASPKGVNYGVYGLTASDRGTGVYGSAPNPSGIGFGVYGESDGPLGAGVFGRAGSPTGGGSGVRGECQGPDGNGVYGNNLAMTGDAFGVLGVSRSVSGTGVLGSCAGSDHAIGVMGLASNTSGLNYGVYGQCDSKDGYAFYADTPGTDYGSVSSIRWKRNVVNIDDPLEKLSRLRGVYYDWDETHGGTRDVGMIAEEVGEVLPEIVQYEANGIDAIGMDYSRMTPLLVEAVNALRAEKDLQIAQRDARIESLELRLAQLETMLNSRRD